MRWRDRDGAVGQAALNDLSPHERRWLFIEGPAGSEPQCLWLSADGTPFAPHSWEAVCGAGSQRCLDVLGIGLLEHAAGVDGQRYAGDVAGFVGG